MSADSSMVTIPARLTISELAGALGLEVSAVQDVLEELGAPASPADLVEAGLAMAVAEAMGIEIRVEARDLALECLYELDSRNDQAELEGLNPRVHRLVSGVMADRESLDADIEAASQHWSISRMPIVDRAILRLGLWELRNDPDTPIAVVVSEAVRLAGTYSTGRSSSFVNGVLATLAKDVR